ncbi:hypothetical protein SLEP1_g54955 [Rubroshorea leprosula]|uniref:Uncharacterized protein n=1 Tax=Rubroshorea leprosula TaxID=152421 RepID=A0AAV5MET9_9ROSI|nr:hypothetical protein SLEP1_g54955 [Rubroshorea leprosula]
MVYPARILKLRIYGAKREMTQDYILRKGFCCHG